MKTFFFITLALAALPDCFCALSKDSENQQLLGDATIDALLTENARLRQRIEQLEIENGPGVNNHGSTHQRPQQWPDDTLLTSPVMVVNLLAGPVYFEVYHQRGNDNKKLETLTWNESVPANNVSSQKLTLFESLRTDWDAWAVRVWFDDSPRYLWSEWTNCSISLYDQVESGTTETVVQLLKGGIAKFRPAGRPTYRDLSFCQASIDIFPSGSSRYAINAFTFVRVSNLFDHEVDVTVALNPQLGVDDRASQMKNITVGAGKTDVVPVFFESNATKNYRERWMFGIEQEDENPWISDFIRCQLRPEHSGDEILLEVSSIGWQLGGDGSPCKGDWDTSGKGLYHLDL